MGLFGGGSPKGIDTGKLRTMLEQGLNKQKGIVEQGFAQLPQFGQAFEQKQGQLGADLVSGSRDRAMEFGKGLEAIDTSDQVKARQGQAQELAFRNLPAAQQAIRENLAATGGLNRGVAVRALQQPVLQASQQAADESFNIQSEADQANIARREQALGTLFNTEQGAALTKLGIDKDTARTLMETGRSDVLNRALQLTNIEGQRTQGLLDIETLAQQQSAAQDAAKRGRLGQVLSTVGGLGGAALGSFGGPLGIAVGSQLGTQLGQAAGGNAADFGPGATNLGLLLAQRRAASGAQLPSNPTRDRFAAQYRTQG